ncbi:MAG: nitroreductase family protein [Lachnospiraceae bacterium]|nr:nitroreductase family protein [Lachnospiraceae bacterium]
MIHIDESLCTGCGLCKKVCSYGNGNIEIDGKAYMLSQYCQECGQCIEVCPKEAITWNYPWGWTKEQFEEAVTAWNRILETAGENLSLAAVYHRKSVRHYQKKAIEEMKMQQILAAGQSAPTASNERELKLIVVEQEREELLRFLIDAYRNWMKEHTEEEILDFFGGHAVYVQKWKRFIKEYEEDGKDGVLFGAPAIVMAAGEEKHLLDAGIVAQTMLMAAQSVGLSTCYVGFLRKGTLISEEFRTYLGLKGEERVLAGFVMGYAGISYQRDAIKHPFEVIRK